MRGEENSVENKEILNSLDLLLLLDQAKSKKALKNTVQQNQELLLMYLKQQLNVRLK